MYRGFLLLQCVTIVKCIHNNVIQFKVTMFRRQENVIQLHNIKGIKRCIHPSVFDRETRATDRETERKTSRQTHSQTDT